MGTASLEVDTDRLQRLLREIDDLSTEVDALEVQIDDAERQVAELKDQLVTTLEARSGLMSYLYQRYPSAVAEVEAGEGASPPTVDDDPFADDDGDSDKPNGYQATLIVLREESARWLEPGEVIAEIERRGWTPDSDQPDGVIRTSLRRAVDRGEADRRKNPAGRGFVYRATQVAPQRPTAGIGIGGIAGAAAAAALAAYRL